MNAVTNPEREYEPRPLTAELFREADGFLPNETIDELLTETWWKHETPLTSVGIAHVFTRPVTLLESVRINPKEYQNHRRLFGAVETDGEFRLTYAVLEHVQKRDLMNLWKIEGGLDGRGKITRDFFRPSQQPLLDHLWKPLEVAATEADITPERVSSIFAEISERLLVNTRWESLVVGLQEGFVNPPLEQWRGGWPDFPPGKARALFHAHMPPKLMAERFGVAKGTLDNQVFNCLRQVGVDTRGELLLAALSNGFYRLDQLEVTRRKFRPTPYNQQVLRLIDTEPDRVAEMLRIDRNQIHVLHGSLRRRLGLESHSQLVCYAFQEGYIPNEVEPELAEVFDTDEAAVVGALMGTDEEIATALKRHIRTVHRLIRSAKAQAGVTTRTELIVYGLRAGIIDPAEHIKPHA